MKTSELTGPTLDWAVAKCEGVELVPFKSYTGAMWAVDGDVLDLNTGEQINDGEEYAPSRIWAQGGPIIERERISVAATSMGPGFEWEAHSVPDEGVDYYGYGPTPLVAAMRCFVTSRLGDEVDVPAELLPNAS